MTDFISSWDTENLSGGSTGTKTVKIPTINTGIYNCTVFWGDGNSNVITTWNDPNWTHVYALTGTYTITISGTCRGFRFNNGGDRLKLEGISQWGTGFRTQNVSGAFYGCGNLNITATDNLDTTGSITFQYMFAGCSSLTTPNFSGWNVSNITNFSWMFSNCVAFNGNVTTWNTGNATTFGSMFSNCGTFNQNIGNWNTGNVTVMSSMFDNCASFNQNIGNWNTSKVQYFSYMFNNVTSFNQNIGNWNTSSAIDMEGMFRYSPFNQNISSWDVSKVTNMYQMFYQATSFNQNIGNWNTVKVTNMSDMFRNATSFNQNIGNWNVTALTDASNMFLNVTLSTINYDALLNGWSAQGVKNSVVFHGGSSKYSYIGGGKAGRDHLTGIHLWTITDGGVGAGSMTKTLTETELSISELESIEFTKNIEESPIIVTESFDYELSVKYAGCFEPREILRQKIGTLYDSDKDGIDEYCISIVDNFNDPIYIPIYLSEEVQSENLPILPYMELEIEKNIYEPQDIHATYRKKSGSFFIHVWFTNTDNIDVKNFAKKIKDKLHDLVRTYQSNTKNITFINIAYDRYVEEIKGRQVVYHYIATVEAMYYDI